MRAKLDHLVLVTIAVSMACAPSSAPEDYARGDIEPANPQETTAVDSLRSLGYLASSREKAEKGRLGTIVFEESSAFPGYNLYVSRDLCRADLIDMRGKLVRFWNFNPCGYWSNAELLPNGDLVVAGAEATQIGERRELEEKNYVLRLTWDGDVIWRKRIYAHHDVDPTPQGGLLTLTAGWRRIPVINQEVDVQDNWLTLLAQDGTILRQLSLYDLLASRPDLFQLQRVSISKAHGTSEIDLFHANSVEWMGEPQLLGTHPIYSTSHVLVSVRHQDTIAVINWESEKIVWAWGQGEISGPHDATLLGNGHILLFDNGLERGWSRVIELDPREKRIVWGYQASRPRDFFTASRGANQRLPNGNTLITNSDSGQVFEVTPEGRIVWEFLNTHLDEQGHRATIVRMKRYDGSFINSFLNQ